MASSEQTLAKQWIEQSTNTIGQLGFMLGSILLYKNVEASEKIDSTFSIEGGSSQSG
jgi:hypothetical protein